MPAGVAGTPELHVPKPPDGASVTYGMLVYATSGPATKAAVELWYAQ